LKCSVALLLSQLLVTHVLYMLWDIRIS